MRNQRAPAPAAMVFPTPAARERLSTLVSFEALKLAAGCVILSPYIPLLFMGEEYGEESPFLYFTSHLDTDLADAVRRGRKNDFKAFLWKGKPPDPQDPQTLSASKLKWEKRLDGRDGVLLSFYRELISLRQLLPVLSNLDNRSLAVNAPEGKKIIIMHRWYEGTEVIAVMNFGGSDERVTVFTSGAELHRLIDSSNERWLGPGSTLPERVGGSREVAVRPLCFALYGEGVKT